MNSHIVNCLEPQPELFSQPQPARAQTPALRTHASSGWGEAPLVILIFGRRGCAVPGRRGWLAETLEDQIPDAGGVGLAAGGLHDRADQRAGRGHLTGPDLGRHVGVRRDRLVDGDVERALIADYG
jgi:hypothetical protein